MVNKCFENQVTGGIHDGYLASCPVRELEVNE